MRKVIVFDMDGTIADFYGVEGWLDDLYASNPRPYEIAKPLVDMTILNKLLEPILYKLLTLSFSVSSYDILSILLRLLINELLFIVLAYKYTFLYTFNLFIKLISYIFSFVILSKYIF